SRIDTSTNGQKPACTAGNATYARVANSSVNRQNSSDTLRPSVSATTPVGTSNTNCAKLNAAFTSITWKMSSPACSKNNVFTPQISASAPVNRPVIVR